MPARTPALLLAVVVGLVGTGCGGGGAPADPTAPAETETSPSEPSTSEPRTAAPDLSTVTTESPTKSRTEGPTESLGAVSIAFVGDVMLARTIGERVLAGQDPFAGVAPQLADADLVVGTLETTVGEGGESQDKAFTFQAPPEAIDSLLAGGFDLVALANNHSYDYGTGGILGTLALLDAAGLAHVGAGADSAAAREPVILSEGGVEVAFLSYVDVPDDWTGYRNRDWEAREDRPGVAWAHPEVIAADVGSVAPTVDHVVVLLHAGTEGSQQPSEVQRAAADAALAAGATAVIGGHPHVLQGYRQDDGQLTAWSLGNFVFDGFGDDPVASQSAILTLQLDEAALTDVTWTPVAITDGFPVALDPNSDEGGAILEHLEGLPN